MQALLEAPSDGVQSVRSSLTFALIFTVTIRLPFRKYALALFVPSAVLCRSIALSMSICIFSIS
jgi:hypothetical protein